MSNFIFKAEYNDGIIIILDANDEYHAWEILGEIVKEPHDFDLLS